MQYSEPAELMIVASSSMRVHMFLCARYCFPEQNKALLFGNENIRKVKQDSDSDSTYSTSAYWAH